MDTWSPRRFCGNGDLGRADIGGRAGGRYRAVCFTPGGGCTDIIVDHLTAARRQVLVQAYSFTSPEIAKALTAARKRGVDVRVILDKSNVCREDGACDKKGAIAADTLVVAKVPVMIDRERVITGSFNFTRNWRARRP